MLLGCHFSRYRRAQASLRSTVGAAPAAPAEENLRRTTRGRGSRPTRNNNFSNNNPRHQLSYNLPCTLTHNYNVLFRVRMQTILV